MPPATQATKETNVRISYHFGHVRFRGKIKRRWKERSHYHLDEQLTSKRPLSSCSWGGFLVSDTKLPCLRFSLSLVSPNLKLSRAIMPHRAKTIALLQNSSEGNISHCLYLKAATKMQGSSIWSPFSRSNVVRMVRVLYFHWMQTSCDVMGHRTKSATGAKFFRILGLWRRSEILGKYAIWRTGHSKHALNKHYTLMGWSVQ